MSISSRLWVIGLSNTVLERQGLHLGACGIYMYRYLYIF